MPPHQPTPPNTRQPSKADKELLFKGVTCALIGLARDDGKVRLNPPADAIVTADDRPILIAEDDTTIRAAEPPAGAALPPPEAQERDMIEGCIDTRPTSRLTCQVIMEPALDGMTFIVPASQV